MTSYLRHRVLLQSRIANKCFNRVEHSFCSCTCNPPTDDRHHLPLANRREPELQAEPSHDHERFAPSVVRGRLSFVHKNSSNDNNKDLSLDVSFVLPTLGDWKSLLQAQRNVNRKDPTKESGITNFPHREQEKRIHLAEESQCHQRRTIRILPVIS